MIRDLLTSAQKRQNFDALLAYALDGNPPPSENGLPGEVEEILLQVALGNATDVDARSVYESST